MKHNLSIEQIKGILNEKVRYDKPRWLKTIQEKEISNILVDEELFECHYLLAREYIKDGNITEAQKHYIAAENQLSINSKLIVRSPTELKKFEECLKIAHEDNIPQFSEETRLEAYKVRLYGIAKSLNYNTENLNKIPTSSYPEKTTGLVELLKTL